MEKQKSDCLLPIHTENAYPFRSMLLTAIPHSRDSCINNMHYCHSESQPDIHVGVSVSWNVSCSRKCHEVVCTSFEPCPHRYVFVYGFAQRHSVNATLLSSPAISSCTENQYQNFAQKTFSFSMRSMRNLEMPHPRFEAHHTRFRSHRHQRSYLMLDRSSLTPFIYYSNVPYFSIVMQVPIQFRV